MTEFYVTRDAWLCISGRHYLTGGILFWGKGGTFTIGFPSVRSLPIIARLSSNLILQKEWYFIIIHHHTQVFICTNRTNIKHTKCRHSNVAHFGSQSACLETDCNTAKIMVYTRDIGHKRAEDMPLRHQIWRLLYNQPGPRPDAGKVKQ